MQYKNAKKSNFEKLDFLLLLFSQKLFENGCDLCGNNRISLMGKVSAIDGVTLINLTYGNVIERAVKINKLVSVTLGK